MENATKALIMAGAVLIAMAIISLSIVVFKNYKSKVDQEKTMDKQEIANINEKILPYVGEYTSGTQVNDLIQKVYALNQSGQTVDINIYYNNAIFLEGKEFKDSSGKKKLPTGVNYNVEVTANNRGYYNRIDIRDST